ncbi:MAG: hypothetical protein IGS48_09830 [Oscillatoriales cyanobacterium C42_A2020_001]|nr:hypothetical protein [Leptolyngbyaceae cyanobacterium C42_A2020_001]
MESAPFIEPEATLPNPSTSSYKDRLNRWAIARIKTDKTLEVVARFRRRSDADGHLRFFQQQSLNDQFIVIFEKQEHEK